MLVLYLLNYPKAQMSNKKKKVMSEPAEDGLSGETLLSIFSGQHNQDGYAGNLSAHVPGANSHWTA